VSWPNMVTVAPNKNRTTPSADDSADRPSFGSENDSFQRQSIQDKMIFVIQVHLLYNPRPMHC
jgi:hypothetical protein